MNQAPITGVCLVDVCGTLVRDDTTIGLLRHHFAQGPRFKRLILQAMSVRKSPLWFAIAAFEKITGRHVLKHAAVLLLAGTTSAALERSASEYAGWLLEQRRLKGVWGLLGNGPERNRIVLASASLEPVVRQLAARMGVGYVASTLAERDGVLTGRYLRDLTGCKEEALALKFEGILQIAPLRVISDNFSDRTLLERASEAYVVLHRQSHRQRWAGLKATFIDAQ